jgi:uncharacterized protein YyaL (SSP411 family)
LLNTAERTLQAASGQIQSQPLAHASLVRATGELVQPRPQVLIGGPAPMAEDWHRQLLQRADLHCYRLPADLADETLPDTLKAMVATEQCSAQVCLGRRCLVPVTSQAELESQLAGHDA